MLTADSCPAGRYGNISESSRLIFLGGLGTPLNTSFVSAYTRYTGSTPVRTTAEYSLLVAGVCLAGE